MKKKRYLILIVVVFLLVALLLFFFHGREKISDFQVEDEIAKIEEAKKYGDKVIGWLRVEGTNIDLPLIEVDDDTNVLRDDYHFAWTNSFPDEKSNRPAFISHNIRNVSRNPVVGDDTMIRFEQLMSFIYPYFMKENKYIEYTNQDGKTALYHIYAVSLLEDDQSASYSDTYTLEEQEEYIKKAKEESMYDIDVDVKEDDLLLTLFTCTRFYGVGTNYSFRVDARKVRENEKNVLSQVTENENYDKIKDRMEEGENYEEV